MSPQSSLVRSQRTGKVCVNSADRKTNWGWKLRNYSVKLKFITTRRGGDVVGVKNLREEKDGKLSQIISLLQLVGRGYGSSNHEDFK